MAYEPFEIDGVQILKGTHIQYNIIGIHHNPLQYYEPESFIPEWFDPTSKYYVKPDGDPWNSLSIVPFSCGWWSCPG